MNITTEHTGDIPVWDPSQTAIPTDFNRSRHRLELTLSRLFKTHAVENVLFVTATFPTQLTREYAMHRFEKLLRKFRGISKDYLWVFERGYLGHVHFHLFLPVSFNTREGVDLERYSLIRREALSAKRKLVNKATRDLWNKVDEWCKQFGIGRTEVAPIYKNALAISRYVVKSVTHNLMFRKGTGGLKDQGDKGSRWWSCSRGLKAVFGDFSFVASRFREAVKECAKEWACNTLQEFKKLKGRHWGFSVKLWMDAKIGYRDSGQNHSRRSWSSRPKVIVRDPSFTGSHAPAEVRQEVPYSSNSDVARSTPLGVRGAKPTSYLPPLRNSHGYAAPQLRMPGWAIPSPAWLRIRGRSKEWRAIAKPLWRPPGGSIVRPSKARREGAASGAKPFRIRRDERGPQGTASGASPDRNNTAIPGRPT